jgi:hypothetical protein
MMSRCLFIALALTVLAPQSSALAFESGVFEGQVTLAKAKRKKRKKRRKRRRGRRGSKKNTVKAVVKTPVVKPTPVAKPEPVKPEAPVSPKEKKQVELEKPGIALTDVLQVGGISDGIARLVNEMILTRLKNSQRFSSVIGGSDMASMLDMESQKQVLGCDDNSCLAQLGGALGVPYLFNAQLGRMGTRIILTLKIIAIEDAKVVVRKIERAKDEGALDEAIEPLVDQAIIELLGAAPPPPAGAEPAVAKPAAAKVVVKETPKRSQPLLKWGGMLLVAGGAGFAALHHDAWQTTQGDFDEQNTAYTTQDLQALRGAADDTNKATAFGLAASGLGLALAVWGW